MDVFSPTSLRPRIWIEFKISAQAYAIGPGQLTATSFLLSTASVSNFMGNWGLMLSKEIAFIVLILIAPNIGLAHLKCAELLQSDQVTSIQGVEALPEEKLISFLNKPTFKGEGLAEHPWAGTRLTDPQSHNPENFLYVIHGKKTEIPSELPEANSIDFVSASLVSNEFTNAFGRFGYILDVKSENVIATWTVDGQTKREDPWAYRHSQGVYSPFDLLLRSGWWWQTFGKLMKTEIYNEVLIATQARNPDPTVHKARISGIYVVVDKAGTQPIAMDIDPVQLGWDVPPLTAAQISGAKVLAEKSNLPFVTIYRSPKTPVILRQTSPLTE